MNDTRHSSFANHASEVRKRLSNRIIGFSDGVFAISITLLVLTIGVPSNLTSSEDVSGFLRQALPQLIAYAAAFMVIGIFWLRHHRMLMLCKAVDGRMLVPHMTSPNRNPTQRPSPGPPREKIRAPRATRIGEVRVKAGRCPARIPFVG
jgi:hypothetical protein